MNAPANRTTLASLQGSAPLVTQRNIAPGFTDLQSFELMQRAAKLLSSSTLVPAAYRAHDEKKGDNPNALANCVVALNMANRVGADPLMVMQNLYIVEGRPSWSSQWIIAAINGCGRFSPLRFDLVDLGQKEVEYETTKWVNRERVTNRHKAMVRNLECVAWAIEKETGARIDSPKVSIEMAVKEGWYGKNGSKWQTMPEVMLRYRTASFFGKLYAPELLMGLQTAEEVVDVVDVRDDGSVTVTTESLRASTAPAKQVDAETGEIVQDTPKRPRQRRAAEPAQDVVEQTEQPDAPERQEEQPEPGHLPEQGLFGDVPQIQWKDVVQQINTASDTDELDAARDLIQYLPDEKMKAELHTKAAQRLAFLAGGEA